MGEPFSFVTGGTLRPDSPSYIERDADRLLLKALAAGEFCYVLDSRQKGKSSLMARAIERLREEGVACAKLDLQRFGTNLDAERWYAGLLTGLGRDQAQTRLLLEHWSTSQGLGPLQRFVGAIESIILPSLEGGRIVVFVDEIDFVRSLSFSTDEFFAGIREMYNRRANEPVFNQITFCLLGVATPSDLIQDVRITPFNIGRRIELTDFTLAEAEPLAQGLGLDGARTLERVLYWTGGHPYLTQRVCQDVAESGEAVDTCVDRLFFSLKAKDDEPNLRDVARRVLEAGPADIEREEYLAGVLDLYRNVLERRAVTDDETNALVSILKLAGLVTVEDGRLVSRNRVYGRVFDLAWVRENMPDAELRRQRSAARKAFVRTASYAAAIIAVLGATAAYAATMSIERGKLAKNLEDANKKLTQRGQELLRTNRDLQKSNSDLADTSAVLRQQNDKLTKAEQSAKDERNKAIAAAKSLAVVNSKLNTQVARALRAESDAKVNLGRANTLNQSNVYGLIQLDLANGKPNVAYQRLHSLPSTARNTIAYRYWEQALTQPRYAKDDTRDYVVPHDEREYDWAMDSGSWLSRRFNPLKPNDGVRNARSRKGLIARFKDDSCELLRNRADADKTSAKEERVWSLGGLPFTEPAAAIVSDEPPAVLVLERRGGLYWLSASGAKSLATGLTDLESSLLALDPSSKLALVQTVRNAVFIRVDGTHRLNEPNTERPYDLRAALEGVGLGNFMAHVASNGSLILDQDLHVLARFVLPRGQFLTPDRRFALARDPDDQTLRLLDCNTGLPVGRARARRSPNSVAIAPDASRVAFAGSGWVEVVRVETGADVAEGELYETAMVNSDWYWDRDSRFLSPARTQALDRRGRIDTALAPHSVFWLPSSPSIVMRDGAVVRSGGQWAPLFQKTLAEYTQVWFAGVDAVQRYLPVFSKDLSRLSVYDCLDKRLLRVSLGPRQLGIGDRFVGDDTTEESRVHWAEAGERVYLAVLSKIRGQAGSEVAYAVIDARGPQPAAKSFRLPMTNGFAPTQVRLAASSRQGAFIVANEEYGQTNPTRLIRVDPSGKAILTNLRRPADAYGIADARLGPNGDLWLLWQAWERRGAVESSVSSGNRALLGRYGATGALLESLELDAQYDVFDLRDDGAYALLSGYSGVELIDLRTRGLHVKRASWGAARFIDSGEAVVEEGGRRWPAARFVPPAEGPATTFHADRFTELCDQPWNPYWRDHAQALIDDKGTPMQILYTIPIKARDAGDRPFFDRALSAMESRAPFKTGDEVLQYAQAIRGGWATEKQLERALGDARKAVALEPEKYKSIASIGALLLRLGRTSEALEALAGASDRNAKDNPNRFVQGYYALVLAKTGEKDRSAAILAELDSWLKENRSRLPVFYRIEIDSLVAEIRGELGIAQPSTKSGTIKS